MNQEEQNNVKLITHKFQVRIPISNNQLGKAMILGNMDSKCETTT